MKDESWPPDWIEIVSSDIVPKGTIILMPKPVVKIIYNQHGNLIAEFEPINPNKCVVVKNIGEFDDQGEDSVDSDQSSGAVPESLEDDGG